MTSTCISFSLFFAIFYPFKSAIIPLQAAATAKYYERRYINMTYKELNNMKAMLYAFSQAREHHSPISWTNAFDEALSDYFKAYPSFEISNEEVSFDEQ